MLIFETYMLGFATPIIGILLFVVVSAIICSRSRN